MPLGLERQCKRKFRIFILWRRTKDLNCLNWNDKKGTKIVKPHLFFFYKKLHVKFCRDIYFTGTDIHICIIALLSTPGAQKDWSQRSTYGASILVFIAFIFCFPLSLFTAFYGFLFFFILLFLFSLTTIFNIIIVILFIMYLFFH